MIKDTYQHFHLFSDGQVIAKTKVLWKADNDYTVRVIQINKGDLKIEKTYKNNPNHVLSFYYTQAIFDVLASVTNLRIIDAFDDISRDGKELQENEFRDIATLIFDSVFISIADILSLTPI